MSTYRLIEIQERENKSWRIEKKNIFGFWYQPNLTYSGSTYYNYDNAKNRYDSLTGKTCIKETILEQSNLIND